MTTKLCKECKMVLFLDDFPKHPQMADGHLNRCRSCTNSYLKQHHEKNKAKHNEAARRWRKENPEHDRDLHAAWRAANPDRVRAIRARAQAKLTGTEKIKTRRRRLDRVRGTKTGPVSLRAILKEHGRVCGICTLTIAEGVKVTFDHVIPLARGGAHTAPNLRPAHKSCNSWKGARLPEELVGLAPPSPDSPDDEWQKRRDERSCQMRSEAMKARWADGIFGPERNAKVSASMKGNANGKHNAGLPRQITDEHRAKMTAGVRRAYDAWTPEQRAAHAAKVSAAKQGSPGNVENLAKGWVPEVRAKAIRASADMRRGTKHPDEHKQAIAEGLKRAYAEGRRKRGHSEETKAKISAIKRVKAAGGRL